MRTITLLVASILLTVNVTKANETKSFNTLNVTYGRFNINEPISFTERGIQFFVFPNGDFDFNTQPQDSHGTYYFKGAGRREMNNDIDRNMTNYGVSIERDYFGRIRRVGNTFINYDGRDRVSRIGSVFMDYNRFALIQIGGMQLIYDRDGDLINMIGSIKGTIYGGYTNYYDNDNHHDNGNHYGQYNGNHYGHNNSDYYYKGNQNSNNKFDDKETGRR